MNDTDVQALEQAALRLLAMREHSRTELRRKLKARAGDTMVLDAVLDGLERTQVLSDRRFVEEYIAMRRRKGFGPMRIAQELAGKGIGRELITELLDTGSPIWDQTLREVARRKFGPQPAKEIRERARRARFLEYRGFATEQIRDLLWDDA